MTLLNQLRKELGVPALLATDLSNPKLKKNLTQGVWTAGLHLAPGNMSGHEVCPKRSPGCTAACLHFAGSPVYYTTKTQARVKKTRLLFAQPQLFLNVLALEIAAHARACNRKGLKSAFRLNVLSDIVWEKQQFFPRPGVAAALGVAGHATDIIRLFPEVTFYDYTKIKWREEPANYHLTFSLSEVNDKDATLEMARGRNVAVVFETAELPPTFWDLPVVNGDEHDYRPADPPSAIVGLKAKGARGKADRSGFVHGKHPVRLAEAA